MADGAGTAKTTTRLLLAFVKQRVKKAIGDETADELGDIGEEQLGLKSDAWLSNQEVQITRTAQAAKGLQWLAGRKNQSNENAGTIFTAAGTRGGGGGMGAGSWAKEAAALYGNLGYHLHMVAEYAGARPY